MKVRSAKILNPNNLIFILFSTFVLLLALRQLADPDLGFHLRYGKYIAEYKTVPETDISTSGAYGNEYIDSQWLFQLLLFGIFKLSGYSGLSVFVQLLTALLVILLCKGLRCGTSALKYVLLVPVLLLFESRMVTRPELTSFIFIAFFIYVLSGFRKKQSSYILILPLCMLLWVNLHSLFITGIFIIAVFFIIDWIEQRKPGKKFGIVLLLSVAACFINPYGIKMLLFPFGLLSRFSDSNIFNEHIAEFQPFIGQSTFTPGDYLFIIWALIIIFLIIKFIRQINPAVTLIAFTMLILAITAIRNIPLFAISSVFVLSEVINSGYKLPQSAKTSGKFIIPVSLFLMVTMIIVTPTNLWYQFNRHSTRFGAGTDKTQLPDAAADFIISNHISGNVINSLGAGGWLSWRLPQKVLIDGRLEVMGEELYQEIEKSFHEGLPALVGKYGGKVIVYNYRKYQPWTIQLRRMKEWKPVFLDGLYVIFIKEGSVQNIPVLTENRIKNTFINVSENSAAHAGMFCLQYGYVLAARELLQKASKQSNEKWLKEALKDIESINVVINRSDSSGSDQRRTAEMHLNLGNELFAQGKTDEAAAEFRLSVQSDSTFAKAYNNLGNILAIQDQLAEAIGYFNKAIQLDQNYADAWLGRGSCKHYLGKTSEACADWQKADVLGNMKAAEFLKKYCR